ncbi:MAG: DNA cytosine methyltransferase [Methylococcales bacterium]|nr:DNA cytosine methyltransferase [Methylococcales bacterium]
MENIQLQLNAQPKVIDLFAGAGGLSLGAARAGFTVSAAVELDKFAIDSHTKNFPYVTHLDSDIAKLGGNVLLMRAGLKKGELDGLIGGPPCQGFSTMGKRQLDDSRNDLFGHFMRLVNETQPAFFLAENVPGILNEKYDGIRKAAFARLPKRYVTLEPITVKANCYGAPTTRTRIFFFGYDPSKMAGMEVADFMPGSNIELTMVREALHGLPKDILSNWKADIDKGWGRTQIEKQSTFLNKATNAVPIGVGNDLALEIYMEKKIVSGCIGTIHSPEVEKRYAELGYGEQDVISKAIKLNPTGFCPTLRAGTGSDKGSFQAVRPIHYLRPRVITPREAARLQGFPDWFLLHSTKWHSFRQIGNSVSPIVSEKLLRVIINKLAG